MQFSNRPPFCVQAAQARAGGRTPASVVPAGAAPQELFRRPGRFHSRLQNIEYECWVHARALPPADRLQARRAPRQMLCYDVWLSEQLLPAFAHV